MNSKIQNLVNRWPKNTVALTSYLNDKFELSNGLLAQYKKSKWITSIGQGAFVKTGDTIHYKGAIYALQSQGSLSIHIGGMTALSLVGLTHFIEMSQKKAFLFLATNEILPKWFKNYDWDVKLIIHQTEFLPKTLGLTTYKSNDYSIQISNRIRALMEVLLIADIPEAYVEAYEIMEVLNDLDPQFVQEYLEHSKSIKVNRCFLFMAMKAKHKWYEKLDRNKINLGKGQRSLVKNGVYNQEYQIMIPKELAIDHGRNFI